ncbi:HECT-domain-containing protein [Pholiota molesta]|nr:HECT-domain-containing protein [Pholiota molesta]
MLPAFGDEWKRKINLGGVSSANTQAAILNRVQAERAARAEHKQRTESAIRIQAWYRGLVDARATRQEMRKAFNADVMGLTGLRCLVLIGKDDEVLGTWTRAVLQLGPDQLFAPARGEHRTSWLVLIRRAALLLAQSVADSPESPNSASYLEVLNTLLSNTIATRVLGADGQPTSAQISEYLLNHQLYSLLSQAIQNIPVESKSSRTLPIIVNIITSPLSTFASTSPQYAQSLASIFTSILTIPLLPNRLPLDVLPKFTSSLPLVTLNTLDPQIPYILETTSAAAKIHLAANIYMFISPQYKKLPSPAFTTYLRLSILLFSKIPIDTIEPRTAKNKKQKAGKRKASQTPTHEDPSDSDASLAARQTRVAVVDDFITVPQPLPMPTIDVKTMKRLEKIISQPHLTALITATQAKPGLFPHLIAYLFALTASWPSAQEQILNVVLASTGGGLVRELYRDLVRRSPLGKEENSGNLMDPANASQWPPILFLADLYSQALLTMGDDEFFGTASGGRAVRNPLTLDELVEFSRQLLNIAFTLYWRDEGSVMQEVYIAPQVRCSWESVRDKVTRCLLGIHARDSRKPFVPADHWLVTSQLDMNSFVEAAVLEEQQLSKPDDPLQGPRHLSKRQLAAMSPRLGILNNIPFAIPFEVRVSIFRHFVLNDMAARGTLRHRGFGPFGHKARVQVRRGMVAQDGFDRLGEVDLKAPIEITFIDQFGQEEAGIDGGGVFKEFFTSLCKEVFDTDRGLWLANKKNELYPNPHAYATEAHSLNWYRFIGRILGKAMYEGILVDVAFAGFFLARWLGRQSFLDDLSSLDPDLYNGLIFLKHYNGNPEDLSLNFTMAIEEFGVTKTVDLIPNGSNIAVTRENRLTYIYLVSHYRLSKQIKQQSEAFFEGLSEMIDQKWLRMFNQQEVQILIGGVNSPIDLDDLRHNTNYGGLYDDAHPVIVTFWQVVNSFDQEQRRALLRFVTSCSRPPLLGFKELVPNFSIRDAGEDQHRLPTSSTCVNLLKLPRYTSERTLREKLLQAINSNAGFDLS